MRKILACALAIVTLVVSIPAVAAETLTAESTLSVSDRVYNMTPEELDAFIAEDPQNYKYLRQGTDEYVEFTVEAPIYEGEIVQRTEAVPLAKGTTVRSLNLQSENIQTTLAYSMIEEVMEFHPCVAEKTNEQKRSIQMTTNITSGLPVYDANDVICAKAYGIIQDGRIIGSMIVGLSEDIPPLLQYSHDGYLYLSLSKEDKLYYNRVSGISTEKPDADVAPSVATQRQIDVKWNEYIAKNTATIQERDIQSSRATNDTQVRINIDTPDYAWYKLCAYTSEAMLYSVFGRRYDPSLLPTDRPMSLRLVEEAHDEWVNSSDNLASNTNDRHRIKFYNMRTTIPEYFSGNQGDSIDYHSYYMSSDTVGNSDPYASSYYGTNEEVFDLHVDIIDTYGVPTLVGYGEESNIEPHIMMGIGYTSSGYFIVRDTVWYDGKPVNSTSYHYNSVLGYDYYVLGVYADEDPTWGTGTLRLGDTGINVKRLRYMLNALYYNVGSITSTRFDATLEAAVKAFQEDYGLTADGIVGSNTYREMRNAHIMKFDGNQGRWRTLSRGKKGDDVAQLQIRLYELRYLDTTDIDGIFGSSTEAALRVFQRECGLDVDGIAGAATFERLYSTAWHNTGIWDTRRHYNSCEYCVDFNED